MTVVKDATLFFSDTARMEEGQLGSTLELRKVSRGTVKANQRVCTQVGIIKHNVRVWPRDNHVGCGRSAASDVLPPSQFQDVPR